MYNGSVHNDQMIRSNTSVPHTVKDKNRVTESQNTIVVSKEKHRKSFIQKIREWFQKQK